MQSPIDEKTTMGKELKTFTIFTMYNYKKPKAIKRRYGSGLFLNPLRAQLGAVGPFFQTISDNKQNTQNEQKTRKN